MSHGEKGNANDSEQAQKAQRLLDKDVPNGDPKTRQTSSSNEEPRPFRPDENVDNQKDASSRSQPEHNTSIEEAPFSGAQVSKEKRAHKTNIDRESDEADPQGRE